MARERQETEVARSVGRVLAAARWAIIGLVVLESELEFAAARIQRPEVVASALIIAAGTLLLWLGAGRFPGLRRPVLPNVADVLMVTLIVYFSDGIQSPFFPLFYIAVIATAATHGMLGGLLSAMAVTVLSLAVELADATRLPTEPLVLEDIVRTVPYLFLIGIITGALRDRVRSLADAAARLREEQARMQRDMETARHVQQAQIRADVPNLPWAEVSVLYEPALGVGGDLYDFYPVETDRFGVAVADVAGKGIPAALLVAAAKYSIRGHPSVNQSDLMRLANRDLLDVTTDETFATMVYGVLSQRSGEFLYVNAGHMPPAVVKAETGEVVFFEQSDPPLGILESATFVERCVRIEPGDVLVLYTDGVTDALASNGDGLDRFADFLRSVRDREPASWRDALLSAAANRRRIDDMTMVTVRLR